MTDQEPWVPVAKNAAKLLPNNRSFTEMEALYSLQLNHNNRNTVTVMGLAQRWGWSRKRVRTFLTKIRVAIVYPKNTMEVTKQRGLITLIEKGTRKGQEKGHINFIDFNKLQAERDKKGDKKRATIIEKEKENNTLTSFQDKKDGVPHDQIVALYHKTLPQLPRVRDWNKKRKAMLQARWREKKKHQTLEWWLGYFEHVRDSPFLMGENGKWQASLEWLVRPSNLLKVIEGNYDQQGR